MNQKQLLSKKLRTAAFAVALLFGTSAAFAQVKIGTNPTTIDPANNLEVEASTAGRKTSVNKTTGKVMIADGTQASGNVFTSDANGVGSWVPNIETGAIANSTTATFIPGGTFAVVQFQNVSLNRGSNFNSSNGVFTAPSTGIYLVTTSILYPAIGVNSQLAFHLFKNNVSAQVLYQNGTAVANTFYQGSGSAMIFLNQGDVIDIRANSNASNSVTGNLAILKLSN
jgi:hypothetical protein